MRCYFTTESQRHREHLLAYFLPCSCFRLRRPWRWHIQIEERKMFSVKLFIAKELRQFDLGASLQIPELKGLACKFFQNKDLRFAFVRPDRRIAGVIVGLTGCAAWVDAAAGP